ncbi:MAG: DUF2627 domain-containing protein [Alicyclobacillus sp.]|nr:DUF2627 domain-containing protein [Alicyclobacillus sp.]
MQRLLAWAVLTGVFLLAGEGLNLFRTAIERWLAYGRVVDALWMIVGLLLAALGTAFLGGFVYYRDKKRGKLTREGWRGRPVQRNRAPRSRQVDDTRQTPWRQAADASSREAPR